MLGPSAPLMEREASKFYAPDLPWLQENSVYVKIDDHLLVKIA